MSHQKRVNLEYPTVGRKEPPTCKLLDVIVWDPCTLYFNCRRSWNVNIHCYMLMETKSQISNTLNRCDWWVNNHNKIYIFILESGPQEPMIKNSVLESFLLRQYEWPSTHKYLQFTWMPCLEWTVNLVWKRNNVNARVWAEGKRFLTTSNNLKEIKEKLNWTQLRVLHKSS